MDELKTFWKTTEFNTAIALLIIQAISSVIHWHPIASMILLGCVGGGYVLSRSMFKRDRQILRYSAWRSSEFYVFSATVVAVLAIGYIVPNHLTLSFVISGAEYFIYCLGRGMVKGLAKQTTVQMIS